MSLARKGEKELFRWEGSHLSMPGCSRAPATSHELFRSQFGWSRENPVEKG